MPEGNLESHTSQYTLSLTYEDFKVNHHDYAEIPIIKELLGQDKGLKFVSLTELPPSEEFQKNPEAEGIEGFTRIEIEVPNEVCRRYGKEGLGLHDKVYVNYYVPRVKDGFTIIRSQGMPDLEEGQGYMSGYLGSKELAEHSSKGNMSIYEADFHQRSSVVETEVKDPSIRGYNPYFVHMSFPTFGSSEHISRDITDKYWDYENDQFSNSHDWRDAKKILLDSNVAAPIEAAKFQQQLYKLLGLKGTAVGHSSASESYQYICNGIGLDENNVLEQVPNYLSVADASNFNCIDTHWNRITRHLVRASNVFTQGERLRILTEGAVSWITDNVVRILTGSRADFAKSHSAIALGKSPDGKDSNTRRHALILTILKAIELGRTHLMAGEDLSYIKYGIVPAITMEADNCVSNENSRSTQRGKLFGYKRGSKEKKTKDEVLWNEKFNPEVGVSEVLKQGNVHVTALSPWGEKEVDPTLVNVPHTGDAALEHIYMLDINEHTFPEIRNVDGNTLPGHNALIDDSKVKAVIAKLQEKTNMDAYEIENTPAKKNALNDIAWAIALRAIEDSEDKSKQREFHIHVTSSKNNRNWHTSEEFQNLKNTDENLKLELNQTEFNYIVNSVAAINRTHGFEVGKPVNPGNEFLVMEKKYNLHGLMRVGQRRVEEPQELYDIVEYQYNALFKEVKQSAEARDITLPAQIPYYLRSEEPVMLTSEGKSLYQQEEKVLFHILRTRYKEQIAKLANFTVDYKTSIKTHLDMRLVLRQLLRKEYIDPPVTTHFVLEQFGINLDEVEEDRRVQLAKALALQEQAVQKAMAMKPTEPTKKPEGEFSSDIEYIHSKVFGLGGDLPESVLSRKALSEALKKQDNLTAAYYLIIELNPNKYTGDIVKKDDGTYIVFNQRVGNSGLFTNDKHFIALLEHLSPHVNDLASFRAAIQSFPDIIQYYSFMPIENDPISRRFLLSGLKKHLPSINGYDFILNEAQLELLEKQDQLMLQERIKAHGEIQTYAQTRTLLSEYKASDFKALLAAD